jgi:hypothetical protein
VKEGRKAFFFEKKKQKTFINLIRSSTAKECFSDKSFLVLFFKKERAFFLSTDRMGPRSLAAIAVLLLTGSAAGRRVARASKKRRC